ncbi:hypothetical protein D3C75_1336250 [compost metagenome]
MIHPVITEQVVITFNLLTLLQYCGFPAILGNPVTSHKTASCQDYASWQLRLGISMLGKD